VIGVDATGKLKQVKLTELTDLAGASPFFLTDTVQAPQPPSLQEI